MFSVIFFKKKFRTTFVPVIGSEQLQLKVRSHCANCCTSKMNFMLTSTNKHCREGKGKLFMLVDRDTVGLSDILNILKEVREECLVLFC